MTRSETTSTRLTHRVVRFAVAALALVTALAVPIIGAAPAQAASYQRISGEGSSWAGNAVQQWVADVGTQGVTVDYTPNGSSQGRKDFANMVNADFAVSEIPFTGDTADPKDNSRPSFDYAMMPMVAGGTSMMYNLNVSGQRFTNLKLSQQAVAKIFTGQVDRWNDPIIAADNPGVNLPAAALTVVVRSEGSGATAQFTLWLLRQFPDDYAYLCNATGVCDGKHATSYFPTGGSIKNFVAQNGSQGVTTYTSSTPNTINYDEYSYAQQAGFPVAKLKNAAGFYTVPTAPAVAVALTQAKINTDKSSANYLSQDLSAVYAYKDPRTYALSAYSYFVVPTETTQTFTAAKGATLAYFAQYSLCEGQQTMGTLGYSPLPMNLVLAALEQTQKIPGIDDTTNAKINAVQSSTTSADGSNPCNNPTFKPGDSTSHNLLVDGAEFPEGCDAACQAPWKSAAVADGPKVGNPGEDPGDGDKGDKGHKGGDDPDAPGSSGDGGSNPDGSTGPGSQPGSNSPPVCDPDTGICSSPSGGGTTTGDGTTTAGGELAPAATSTMLAGDEGWAGPQTLILISLFLLVALLAGAPAASVIMGKRGSRPGRSSGSGPGGRR